LIFIYIKDLHLDNDNYYQYRSAIILSIFFNNDNRYHFYYISKTLYPLKN